MIVYLARDILPFVMYCFNGKPRSSLLIEFTDSMIISIIKNVERASTACTRESRDFRKRAIVRGTDDI